MACKCYCYHRASQQSYVFTEREQNRLFLWTYVDTLEAFDVAKQSVIQMHSFIQRHIMI